jgi:hypothetical protein
VRNATHTHFLNVDLDIFSKRDLQPLLNAFGKKVYVLYSGHHGRTYRVHVELAKITKSVDAAIRDFCALIDALPKAVGSLWSQAKQRDFNIGVQAGMSPHYSEFVLSPETLRAANKVDARIVFTVYAPEKSQKAAKKRRAASRKARV